MKRRLTWNNVPDPDAEYLLLRKQTADEISELNEDDIIGNGDVYAMLIEIPVRARSITLACFRDGSTAVYYSANEAKAATGRRTKKLRPICERLFAFTCCMVESCDKIDEICLSQKIETTRIFIRSRHGLQKFEYHMDRLDECPEQIRQFDAILKELVKKIRQSKDRT